MNMKAEQYDIFGNLNEVEIKKPSKKTPTMQEIYGVIPDKQCRSCDHLYARRQSATWYKCELWDEFFRGSSEASDIRLKNQACKKYIERSENNGT